MTILIPDRAVRDYLTAFDLATVYVIAPKADTPCDLGAGCRAPGASQRHGGL